MRVAAIKAEATETSQTFAKVSIYTDQRIGEILRELPKKQGKRTDTTSSPMGEEVTKAQALEDAGISRKQAYDLQAMAANPEVVLGRERGVHNMNIPYAGRLERGGMYARVCLQNTPSSQCEALKRHHKRPKKPIEIRFAYPLAYVCPQNKDRSNY